MNRSVSLLLSALIIGIISFGACKPLEDPCEETQWKDIEDPVINIRLTSEASTINHNLTTYQISQASEVSFTGTITKYYCSGKESGSFDFSATFLPVNGTIALNNIKIGGPYQFNFQNDKDYVSVSVRMRVAFPDGTVFRPRETDYRNFYFKNIQLNANNLEYYVLFTIYSSTIFVPV